MRNIKKLIAKNNNFTDNNLGKVFNETVNQIKQREKEKLNRLIKTEKTPLIIFGAGNLGRKILKGLRYLGLNPIGFADNNYVSLDAVIDGIRVYSPKDAAHKFAKKAVFIISIWAPHHSYLKTFKQLQDLKCLNIIPFQLLIWKYPDIFSPHYQFVPPHEIRKHKKKIMKVFKLLSDQKSRREFYSHIRWRMFLDYNTLPKPDFVNQYFPDELISVSRDEVFIDCGAYNGDTLKKFLEKSKQGNFKKIICFEPDPNNFAMLRNYAESLNQKIKRKILFYNYAVGSKSGELKFTINKTTGSFVDPDGQTSVKSIPLDEIVIDERPTFLKFDVEGSELAALRGSSNIIRQYKPIVAVCVYHKPNDIWEIPLYLYSMNRDYQFYFRTYDHDGLELVIYAIPKDRVRKI